MEPLHRRDVLKGALLGTAAAAFPRTGSGQETSPQSPRRPWKVIDVNVNLFQWPFRRLPFDEVDELAGKLRSLRIDQAWAGSYEALLQRDLGEVNRRLATACRDQGGDVLRPFGVVNPDLPGWEEDLRQCHEDHAMPGVRLYPNYHGYALDAPRFERLLAMAAERGLLVQLAVSMEDTRTQHPKLQVPDVDLSPLPELMKKVPEVRVMILNHSGRGELVERLAETGGVSFDTARVEGTDGITRLMRSVSPDRVVFGTHAPFFIYESGLIKVYESRLTETEIKALFEENAEGLLPRHATR